MVLYYPAYLNFSLLYYSYLSDLEGFLFAILHVRVLTVSNATATAIDGPAKNAHTGIGVWKLNLPRKILPRRRAVGNAMKTAIASHLV